MSSTLMKRISFAALTAVLVLVSTGCVTSRKTDAQRQLDRETADRVQAALNDDRTLYARHIVVRADDGVVRLGGYVWTQPDLDEALRIAENVQGVTKVVNDLELERAGSDNPNISR